MRNSLSTGIADYTFGYGAPDQTVGHGANNWTPIAGDWDGNGSTTIGFFAPASSTFMLRNTLTTGIADLAFGYGAAGAGWQPIIGCWYAGPEQSSVPAGPSGAGMPAAFALRADLIDDLDLPSLVDDVLQRG